MPGTDGRTLAANLIEQHPGLKVLLMSGYTQHPAVKTASLGSDEHYIAKPFTAAELSTAVRRALDAAR